MDLVKDCLLHCLLGVDVQDSANTVFDLHRPHTLTVDVLPESVVETAPESFVLFSFDNGEDIAFGGFIGSVLRRVEAVL